MHMINPAKNIFPRTCWPKPEPAHENYLGPLLYAVSFACF